MLIAKNLNKRYTSTKKLGIFSKNKIEVEAVKDISISLDKGTIVGLVGLNGAGKTTTIRMLSGLIEPSQGTYTLDGIDVIKNYSYLKSRVNVISGGERNLYWRISAKENLNYFCRLYGLSGKILKNKVSELLEFVELSHVADQPVESFSKGMKQRLQFARGLINSPDYLFLDEPTLGLDLPVAKKLRRSISESVSGSGRGVVLTSHYMSEIEELCDYLYVVSKGEVIYEGNMSSLSIKYKESSEIHITLDDLTIVEQLKFPFKLNGSVISVCEKNANQLLEAAVKRGININDVRRKERNLEDFIMELSDEHR